MDSRFVVLPGSERPPKQTAKRIGDVDPESKVEVTLTLRGPELPEPDASAPAPSREEFESSYGANPDDIVRARGTLERFGLTVEDVSPAARSMRVSGTAAQMEEAFHPELALYESAKGRKYRGREKELRIPAELEGIVTGVFGLDQRRVARRGRGSAAAQATAAQVQALGPGDLERHYGFPPGGGKGQKIGIAEFDGAYFPEDLKGFCSQHGLPVPQVTVVDAGLRPPEPDEIGNLPERRQEEVLGASVEVMMDIEIVAGLCPEAEIVVYFATFDQKGWIDLLNELIVGRATGASVLSVSWGLPEDDPDWSRAALEEVNQRLKAAAYMGITVCVASGDDGSGDQMEDGRAHVDFPASSPFVLSVGGTMIDGDREVTWWQSPGQRRGHGGATGGGVSTVFERPPWQTVEVGSLNPDGIDGRVVPDITALAGPPFYDLFVLGEKQGNGGTSAATPLWASLLGRIFAAGKPSNGPAFIAPLLYERLSNGESRGQATCTDITDGDNTSNPEPGRGYEAGPGYDAVSGWGAPNGQQLLDSLP